VVDKAQYDLVMGITDNAKAEDQGTLLLGGKPLFSKVSSIYGRRTLYLMLYRAIFTDTKPDASIYKEEIFLARLWWSANSRARRKFSHGPTPASTG
jgi:aldehyde dehydrogenase (NAD+)/retinal dehydrogenase